MPCPVLFSTAPRRVTPPPPWSLPLPDHPFHEEILPNVQPEPPLVQLEAMTSGPVACYLGEEATPQPGYNILAGRQPTDHLQACSRICCE